MAQGEFTLEEAMLTRQTVTEMFDALTPKKKDVHREQFLGADAFLCVTEQHFLAAAQVKPEPEPTPLRTAVCKQLDHVS